MDAIDLKYAKSILIELSKRKVSRKTDLSSIVKSHQVLDNLLLKLQSDGYIDISEAKIGHKTYSITLTSKGNMMVEQLLKAEEIANSPSVEVVPKSDLDLTMTEEEAEMAKHLNLLFHINVMDDHITVEEVKPGKPPRIFNIYVKRNGNGEFRLWCEHDDSYDCWHVKAAWTYPHVQKMMMHYKGKIKVCPSCGFENPEVAKFCMNCGVKLE
ncbi:zinc ribbon domain-containing protein [Cuniculiplasma sp. SKW4]|uniref:zinc ribbon domain-containing protein n=1 Tax=Cuniculiplasma sp. SKW4 TaxID=3400171 RepID=UPI003FD04AE0